jgi:hypothetical protein
MYKQTGRNGVAEDIKDCLAQVKWIQMDVWNDAMTEKPTANIC